MIKNPFRSIILLIVVVFLLAGYGSADPNAGEPVGNITAGISRIEQQLDRSPLEINDSFDSTGLADGFLASDATTLSLTGTMVANQIPKGGFVEFGPDKRTRIFTPEGYQIAYADDVRSSTVTTPSGMDLPSTHIIGIPNGAAIHTRENREYVSVNGEVILTIIDLAPDTSPEKTEVPSTLAASWVEFAESDSCYYLNQFHANWQIPHSPNIDSPNETQVPTAYNANILFDGIEPQDGSSILQPVTAFDYYAHSACNTDLCKKQDPAILNKWTGSGWYCPQNNNYCTHTMPALSFAEGEVAQGNIYYDGQYLHWVVVLQNVNRGTSTSYSTDVIQNPTLQSLRSVITYEWGGTTSGGSSPLDREKIENALFYGVSALNSYGQPISLNWQKTINHNDHTQTHGLDVQFSPSSVSPSQITLCTNWCVLPLPGYSNLPTDPDSDGLYEDLNGNGRTDNGDVVVFFKILDWVRTNEPLAAFDFNGNSRIDNGDVIVLFKEL